MRYIGVKILDEKGFSLIEILIAITVFAIGILALGKMQITSIKGNSCANELSRATILAQDKTEELISLPYDTDLLKDSDTDGKAGLDDTNAAADHNDPNNPVNDRYNIFWNIATDYPINNTKEIRIIITWIDRGVPKSISITSMKAITI